MQQTSPSITYNRIGREPTHDDAQIHLWKRIHYFHPPPGGTSGGRYTISAELTHMGIIRPTPAVPRYTIPRAGRCGAVTMMMHGQ